MKDTEDTQEDQRVESHELVFDFLSHSMGIKDVLK